MWKIFRKMYKFSYRTNIRRYTDNISNDGSTDKSGEIAKGMHLNIKKKLCI